MVIVAPDQVPATWLDATPGSAAWCRCTAALRGGGAVFAAPASPGDRRRPAPSPRSGTLAVMATLSSAQLSALASGIDDLSERAVALAVELEAEHEAEASAALYEVERSLRMATRSMDRARRALEG